MGCIERGIRDLYSNVCSIANDEDTPRTLTGSFIGEPLAESFDNAITTSRLKAAPYAAAITLLGAPLFAIEAIVRIALAIISVPLLLCSKEMADIPIFMFKTAIDNISYVGLTLLRPITHLWKQTKIAN